MSNCNETIDFVEERTPPDNAPIKGTLAGKINHDKLDMSDKASCTFNRFPRTVAKLGNCSRKYQQSHKEL